MHANQEQLAQQLQAGLGQLKLDLNPQQQQALLDYLGLLLKWNAVYNLTAIRDPQQILIAHLFDSLALIPIIQTRAARFLLDVGSGGGLPGIPLAIALPDLQVDLVDAVQKKVAFQQHVRNALYLFNLKTHHARVEQLRLEHPVDLIVARAFSSLAQFVKLAGPLLKQEGQLLAMKGALPHQELAHIPNGWHVSEIIELHIPDLNAERCLVCIQRH